MSRQLTVHQFYHSARSVWIPFYWRNISFLKSIVSKFGIEFTVSDIQKTTNKRKFSIIPYFVAYSRQDTIDAIFCHFVVVDSSTSFYSGFAMFNIQHIVSDSFLYRFNFDYLTMISENGNDFIGFPLASEPFPLMLSFIVMFCVRFDHNAQSGTDREEKRGRKWEKKKNKWQNNYELGPNKCAELYSYNWTI